MASGGPQLMAVLKQLSLPIVATMNMLVNMVIVMVVMVVVTPAISRPPRPHHVY